MIKPALKTLARWLLGDYTFYQIYRLCPGQLLSDQAIQDGLHFDTVGQQQLEDSGDELIREQGFYLGADCFAFGCFDQQRIVAVCFIWHGERYKTRNFWPLAADEAKLVQIITLPDYRGRRIASRLIGYAAKSVLEQGFSALYARIWHSNLPSIAAFERTGWRKIATVIELFPFKRKRPLRLVKKR